MFLKRFFIFLRGKQRTRHHWNLLLGWHLLCRWFAASLLLLEKFRTSVVSQFTILAVNGGALPQRVVGDGDQLVALAFGVTQLEAIEIVQQSALQEKKNKEKLVNIS